MPEVAFSSTHIMTNHDITSQILLRPKLNDEFE